MMTSKAQIRIGGASGYWGESDMAVPQFLDALEAGETLDYIVFDYLAEITMSILARQRSRDPSKGYAADFIHDALAPNLARIAKHGIKIISNAGGVNPAACAKALREVVKAAGLDLKIGVITGDDILSQVEEFRAQEEMFTGDAMPPADTIVSANAYLGAFPIARALDAGADIIITGRVVDSAVTLGACIHEFGWGVDDFDLLASGSLAGHIIECGPQVTGGNYTDWEDVADTIADIGYPIATINADGSFELSKPKRTGGTVTVGTVGEQMLYEIGDPQAYFLPDVVCDFSQVTVRQTAKDRVHISPAVGHAAPNGYKACVTYNDGWKIVSLWMFVGENARAKGAAYANGALTRARKKLHAQNSPDYSEVLVEFFGDDSHYGDFANESAHENVKQSREVVMKLAAKHMDKSACALLYREATGLALATPVGLAPLSAARPKPSPIIRLFSLTVPKQSLSITIDVDGQTQGKTQKMREPNGRFNTAMINRVAPPALPATDLPMTEVKLIDIAFGRSGDKGNKANIGILPRDIKYAPYIWAALSEAVIAARFAHFNDGSIERFYLPATGSMNILLERALGGGGMASLRNDPQGKTYAQILLQTPIAIPSEMSAKISAKMSET